MGEVETAGGECLLCEGNTYSIDPSVGQCTECDTSVSLCYGSYTLIPQPGYWRIGLEEETFWECPNKEACTGSPDYPDVISYTGECATGYKGNMC